MIKYALTWLSRERLQDCGRLILSISPKTILIHYGDDPLNDSVLVFIVSELLPVDGFNGMVEMINSKDEVRFDQIPDELECYKKAVFANLLSIYSQEIRKSHG